MVCRKCNELLRDLRDTKRWRGNHPCLPEMRHCCVPVKVRPVKSKEKGGFIPKDAFGPQFWIWSGGGADRGAGLDRAFLLMV